MVGLRLPSAECSLNVLSCPAAGSTTARCPAPPSRRAFPMKPPALGISAAKRWPDGFVCPACGRDRGWELKRRRASWECAACGKETSVTAGTIMHRSHLPLKTWLMAVRVYGSFCSPFEGQNAPNSLNKSGPLLGGHSTIRGPILVRRSRINRPPQWGIIAPPFSVIANSGVVSRKWWKLVLAPLRAG